MHLLRLLEIHKQHSSSDGIEQNFGDGYLLNHNRIYRNMRKEAQLSGFHYAPASNDQLVLPFLQLESILKNKEIPYIDNTSPIEKLVVDYPHLTWTDIYTQLKRNYVFHESCHATARAVFMATEEKQSDAAGLALQIFLEESFANTCELIAMLDAEDAAHQIFFEQNSYTWLPEMKSLFKKVIDQNGELILMKLLLLAYLYSNLLRYEVPEKQFSEILDLLQVEQSNKSKVREIKKLISVAFTLDEEFRTVTSALHLKLHRLSVDLKKIDLLCELKQRPTYFEIIDKLCVKALAQ